MKLEEALDQIANLEGDEVIFAKKPWSMQSEAVISHFEIDSDGEYRVPPAISAEGYDYFLEGHVANEVLDSRVAREATPQERHELLLYYAIHDAFPEWTEER